LALCIALATLAAVWSVYRIELSPPGLQARNLEIAAASTRVLIDSPKSKIIDLDAGTADFTSLTTRADLLGNVMASSPVREYIARHAGVAAERIKVVAPITASVPRVLTEPGSEKRASDLLASAEQYRLDIQADPTVPVLDIYSQAPSPEAATRLANSAVSGLRDYLHEVAIRQGVDPSIQVRVLQLGQARGGVINNGVNVQVALLAFILVLVLSCCALLFLSRVRRGWTTAALVDRDPSVAGPIDDFGPLLVGPTNGHKRS
jgi:hypothetical protein